MYSNIMETDLHWIFVHNSKTKFCFFKCWNYKCVKVRLSHFFGMFKNLFCLKSIYDIFYKYLDLQIGGFIHYSIIPFRSFSLLRKLYNIESYYLYYAERVCNVYIIDLNNLTPFNWIHLPIYPVRCCVTYWHLIAMVCVDLAKIYYLFMLRCIFLSLFFYLDSANQWTILCKLHSGPGRF